MAMLRHRAANASTHARLLVSARSLEDVFYRDEPESFWQRAPGSPSITPSRPIRPSGWRGLVPPRRRGDAAHGESSNGREKLEHPRPGGRSRHAQGRAGDPRGVFGVAVLRIAAGRWRPRCAWGWRPGGHSVPGARHLPDARDAEGRHIAERPVESSSGRDDEPGGEWFVGDSPRWPALGHRGQSLTTRAPEERA